MKNIKIILAISFLNLLLSSCATYYYAPSEQAVLKFTEKNQFSGSVSKSEAEGTAINAAYSLTDNIGFNTNYQEYQKNSIVFDSELIFYKKINKNFYPAVNLGYSWGDLHKYTGLYNLNLYRFYLQPSVGFSNDYFDFALSTRFSTVNYNLQIKSNRISNNNGTNLYDVGHKRFLFIEPALTAGIGYKFIKLRFQYAEVHQNDNNKLLLYENNIIVSLNFRFNL